MTTRATHEIDAGDLIGRAAVLLDEGLRVALVAAHDDGTGPRLVYTFLGDGDRRVELTVRVDPARPHVPSLAGLSFAAGRFEREMHDLFGVVPDDHPFPRPLVRHAHWPDDWFPMRAGASPAPTMRSRGASYPFVEVEGAAVYEIPVGPIHAGLIEPGHFRFSVVGETIVKMTARLWFLHRGVERMFQGLEPDAGVRLAERVSGDSAIGHGLAFTLAVEEALGVVTTDEASADRATLLELERLYNHVGDLGAMANDVAFGVANARALILREELLRLNESVTGHRLLRGAVSPGRTTLRRLPTRDELDRIGDGVDDLVELALSHSVVRDRFEGTAVLSGEDARLMGTLGVVARASGRAVDARRDHPFVEDLEVVSTTQTTGDVLARFRQRAEEVRASIALIDALRHRSSPGEFRSPASANATSGLGVVEGWRGTIVQRVELDVRGRLTRVRVVDPSFFNWPALAVSLADTIVPDFPLVNKSFNLSYAGNDL